MLTVLYVEERLKVFDRLGKVSFHASARGHEKLQIGITLLLKPRYDWFFTYYREKGIPIGLGMPLKDIFLGMLSRQSDPNSAGRNMPETGLPASYGSLRRRRPREHNFFLPSDWRVL